MAAPVPLVQSDTVTVPVKQNKIFMWVAHLVQIASLLTSACFMYATLFSEICKGNIMF